MNQDDGEESEPDDIGIWDSGAASVLVSRMHLKKYLRSLLMIGFDVHQINAWTCTKGFKFGRGNRGKPACAFSYQLGFKEFDATSRCLCHHGQGPLLAWPSTHGEAQGQH